MDFLTWAQSQSFGDLPGIRRDNPPNPHLRVLRRHPYQPERMAQYGNQIGIVGNQDNRPFKHLLALHQGLAAVHVQMVCWFIKQQDMGAVKARERQHRSGLLPAR